MPRRRPDQHQLGRWTRSTPGTSVYSLTKFGIGAFAESLRQKLIKQRVRVSLVEAGQSTPSSSPIFAGPWVYEMAELVRGYLRACPEHRPISPLWLRGKAARTCRAGANLAPGRAVGRRTW